MQQVLDLQAITGLSDQEAANRLKQDGFNELPSQKKQSILSIFIGVVKEPMLALLIVSGLIYLFMGELKDALMLMFFVFVVIGITFYQERKTERALEALKNLASPRALVIRGSQQKRIPGREVVRKDVIILREGDRVPADGVVVSCSNLLVDESLLTGESLSVRKTEWDGKQADDHPGGDDRPFVYSGTLVVQGTGVVAVTLTGVSTQMGRIGRELETIREEETLLKKETGKIVRNFAIAGIALCFLVVIIYGLTRFDWIKGFLAGLTLSMAMLPEEFPVVLLIFMSLGAWRISKKNVLTRRIAAIETLGAATVLCVDKTGTLTQNMMSLSSIFSGGNTFEIDMRTSSLPEEYHKLLEYSVLASQIDPFDPIEKEIISVGKRTMEGTEHIHHGWALVKEYPLSKKLLALSNVWESPDRSEFVIASKGAPESIADLCHMAPEEASIIDAEVKKMSDRGYRVLGVAKALFKKGELPEEQHDFNYEFIGLLGFVDPVRPTVKASLSECYSAGIRVIMITGDYPGTAKHVARQIGLKEADKCITGPELRSMGQKELQEKIRQVNVFARVVPEQKLLIVNALKANGEIAAMTGDGVNDAPALKASNIGIAMGERGTDVARESAALVLLDDNFSSIVSAARLGRRIYDNLKKAMAFILTVHVPIAGMSLLPVLLNLPLVLLPAHIAFLELIIDPACSVVFESQGEEGNVMARPPRSLRESLLSRQTVIFSLLQGFVVLAVTFIVFTLMLYYGKNEAEARTVTFMTLVIADLLLIFTNLSWKKPIYEIVKEKNLALWVVSGSAVIFLALVIMIPFLRDIFHFSAVHPNDLFIAVTAGLISVGWFEGLKMLKN